MLALEIFGAEIALPDFPVLKGVRCIGMSDSADYASRLAEKFDYRNTEYDREPRFDVTNPSESEFGSYDFVLCSEVLEHVVAPVDVAFRNLFRLLKPHGVLLMSVPYSLDAETVEHFGPMEHFSITTVADRAVLIRMNVDGGYEVLDKLHFHGGSGSTLEMRVFSERELRRHIASAGFSASVVHGENCAEFGIFHDCEWSLPIAAQRDPFVLTADSIQSWSRQWKIQAIETRRALESEIERQTAWARDLERQLDERTAWAHGLERDVEERTAWAKDLEKQLEMERQSFWSLRAEADLPIWRRIVRKLKRLAHA